MSQTKKIEALEQLIVDSKKALELVKKYDLETKKLDDIMSCFNQHRKQNFLNDKALDFKMNMISEAGMSYDKYLYEVSFNIEEKLSDIRKQHKKNRLTGAYSYLNLEESYNIYHSWQDEKNIKEQLKKIMATHFPHFDDFVQKNYSVNFMNKTKKVISTSSEFYKIYFIQELDYALVYHMDFASFKTSIFVESKDNALIIKQFDKQALQSYFEKTQLENIILTEDKVNLNHSKKTVKI